MKGEKIKSLQAHVPQLNKPLVNMKNISKFGGDYCAEVFSLCRTKYYTLEFSEYQTPLVNSN